MSQTMRPPCYLNRWIRLCLITSLVAMLFSHTCLASENSQFVEEFIRNYDKQNFNAQVNLVQKNKSRVAQSINELTQQALNKKQGFDKKMYLLNIASSMAYMNAHWNGDYAPLKKLDPVLEHEAKQEQQRRKQAMEGKKNERLLGNFVMGRHEKKLQEAGLAKVLYPHWLHRSLFECKVCHNAMFNMKRWSNKISQQNIIKGEQCGVCHNGTLAFSASAKDQCQRCHLVGKPEAEQLHDPNLVSQAKIKQMAEKVGATWRPENLPNGKFPLDRFGFINWLVLKKRNVFTPVVSLDKNYKEVTRDTKILFKSKSDFVDNVLFDHKIHSDWLKCESCHPAIFNNKLGGNNIKMLDMRKGRYCGHCHGKVSFTFADCKRCHKESNKRPPGTALIR